MVTLSYLIKVRPGESVVYEEHSVAKTMLCCVLGEQSFLIGNGIALPVEGVILAQSAIQSGYFIIWLLVHK